MFGVDVINPLSESNTMQPQMQATMPAAAPKQMIIAFLLAFFVGGLGIHNFYLGKTGKGIAQLVLTITVIGALVSLPWAFIEAILIVMGKGSDSDGNPLV